ncbi:hypothetical protein FRC00_002916 [Tulasnella sp. 408]|nr:hypothetical protein FRC00_002916 [Tulasnella sp. 408]
MPGGLLASESSPTTPLSKHFHDLPDPNQTSSDFCNSFWGGGDRGVEVLFDRMHGAARTMEEVQGFWRERIAIEEEYATKLAELAKLPLGKDEIGDLRVALDTVRAETNAQASRHLTFVQTMKKELEQPSENFISKQNNHKKTFQAAIETSYKAKQTQEKYVEKAREKYESDCVLINSYTAQSTLLQGKELDKIQTRLERAQQTVQASERDYQNFARALGDMCKRWEREWKTYCDQCQTLEEERINFIKDNVWAYANAVSISCEKIRVDLEQVDVEEEVENFVKHYGTGSIISEPVLFIPHTLSSPPGRPKQKVSTFVRSSVIVPLAGPAFAESPLEVGRASGSVLVGNLLDASNQATKHPVDPNDPIARALDALKKGGGVTRNGVGSISSTSAQFTDKGAKVLFHVKALYDYKATTPEEFDFQAGDIIAVTATPDDGWWSGMLLDETRRIPGRTVFPSNFMILY